MNEERNDNLTAANAKGAESFTLRATRIVTMNRRRLLPLRCLPRLVRGWRRGEGRGHEGHLEFGYCSFFGIWSLGLGAFLGFGVWDLELPPAGSWRVSYRWPAHRLPITSHK